MTATVVAHKSGGRAVSSVPRLVRTEQELAEAVDYVSQFDYFVIDVETDGKHPVSNEVSWVGLAVVDRVFLIPMGHPNGPIKVPQHRERRVPPIEERKLTATGKVSLAKKEYTIPAVFHDPGPQLRQDVVFAALEPLLFSDRRKIGHNVKYDLQSVAKYYGGRIAPGPYDDTIILCHILDENLPAYGLKQLVMDWLKVPKNPEVRKAFYPNLGKSGIAVEPIDKVAQYLAKDVWYCLQYYRYLKGFLKQSPTLTKAYEFEMEVYGVLMTMEMRGVTIDVDMLEERGQELRDRQDGIEQNIYDICGEEFEITNLAKKRHFLFGKKRDGGQGLKPLSYTDKTKVAQVNQATLDHYAETNELARLLLMWSETEKVIGTFIIGLQDKLIDGRLHTSFNQHRTVTSRLSSNNPNLQQIPRGTLIRDAFIPSPGMTFVVIDYDQVELRCAAYLSGDQAMQQVFIDDLDIHAEAASTMLDIPAEDLTPEQRQLGKTQNFGVSYGAGPQKLATTANVSLERAQEFVAKYYLRFSGFRDWKINMVRDAKRRAKRTDPHPMPFTLIPPFNRHRRLPGLFSDDYAEKGKAERQVVNSIVQGFAAYVLKLALVDLAVEVPKLGGFIVLNVHDEVVVEFPEDRAEEGLELVKRVMGSVTYDGVPILGNVPLTAKGSVATRWSEGK